MKFYHRTLTQACAIYIFWIQQRILRIRMNRCDENEWMRRGATMVSWNNRSVASVNSWVERNDVIVKIDNENYMRSRLYQPGEHLVLAQVLERKQYGIFGTKQNVSLLSCVSWSWYGFASEFQWFDKMHRTLSRFLCGSIKGHSIWLFILMCDIQLLLRWFNLPFLLVDQFIMEYQVRYEVSSTIALMLIVHGIISQMCRKYCGLHDALLSYYIQHAQAQAQ